MLLAHLSVVTPVAWIFSAYLLGSIPVAWLLTKWVTGQDLRRLGSGNVGVMNTALSATRWAGLVVFLCEAAKGFLAVILPRFQGQGDIIVGLVVIAVVLGSRWSIWLGFKGGRGNTAGMSALLMISWQTMVFSLAVWVLARLLVHNSFKATRISLVTLPIITAGVTQSWWYALVSLALALIYLGAQQPRSDDHQIIKERWPSFWAFLTSPRRRG
jgi:glycerol-3-phosphate acyltransferase PlsY